MTLADDIAALRVELTARRNGHTPCDGAPCLVSLHCHAHGWQAEAKTPFGVRVLYGGSAGTAEDALASLRAQMEARWPT